MGIPVLTSDIAPIPEPAADSGHASSPPHHQWPGGLYQSRALVILPSVGESATTTHLSGHPPDRGLRPARRAESIQGMGVEGSATLRAQRHSAGQGKSSCDIPIAPSVCFALQS